MYSIVRNKLSNEHKGILLDLLFFLKEMPNVSVHFDGSEEFRVSYCQTHTHVSFIFDDFQTIYENLKEIIKDQNEYNKKNVVIYLHEDLKAKGLRSYDVFGDEKDKGKITSIISKKQYEEYNEKIKEIIEKELK